MDPVSLKWTSHNSNLINSLDHFKAVDNFVDVTLVCEGHTVKAHKIILSAGSNVLRRLLLANPAKHPILILTETKYDTLRLIIDFLYKGRVDVPRGDLPKVLKVATTFEINDLKTLCKESLNSIRDDDVHNSHPILSGSSPKKKRQRRRSSDSDILFEDVVPKKESNFLPCRFEPPEGSPVTGTTLTEMDEFEPQISDARSVKSSTGIDSTGSSVQKIQKDAATECDIQPLKELMSNSVPISRKPSRNVSKPTYADVTEDSDSDTSDIRNIIQYNQSNMECTQKKKRSTIWPYFVRVNNCYAVCKLCRRKLSYRTTVTNLRKHLLKKHRRFDPYNPPKLPDIPLLRLQTEQLEIFEEIDFKEIEAEAGIQGDESLQDEKSLDEDLPSTSTPYILKINEEFNSDG